MSGVGAEPGPIVFLGTAAFAVPSLRALVAAGERVALVVTQPDRPRGRGRVLEASPVKQAAVELGLPVFQPERVSAAAALERLGRCRPEFLAVIAFGQLLRKAALEVPAVGAVNLHPSLLPRHRGPAPVAAAILAGDAAVGNSTMFLDEGMDSGPVLLQERFPMDAAQTRGEVEGALARAGARLLAETLRQVRAGGVRPCPQDPELVTYSHMVDRAARAIDWIRPAAELRRLVHALAPAPAALTRLQGRLLKVLRARELPGSGSPGQLLELTDEGPVVACGEGRLLLLEVQPEGKRTMSGAAFARGSATLCGAVLEHPWASGA